MAVNFVRSLIFLYDFHARDQKRYKLRDENGFSILWYFGCMSCGSLSEIILTGIIELFIKWSAMILLYDFLISFDTPGALKFN